MTSRVHRHEPEPVQRGALRHPLLRLAICLLVAGGVGLTGACSQAASPDALPPVANTAAGATPDDEPSGTATRPADALASDLPTVTRTGTPDTKASAAPSSFSSPVTFGDGVTVRVTAVKQSVDKGKGPGVFTGSPITQVWVQLVNKSKDEVKLDQVVVSMLYGSPLRAASPVYAEGAQDLSGVVTPGQSADALYMFSVPTQDLTKVSLTVDFDGRHTAATFEGSVA